MRKLIFSFLVLAMALVAGSSTAFAQKETTNGVAIETDVVLLRRDLRTDKRS